MGGIGLQGQIVVSAGLVPTQCPNARVVEKMAGNQQRRSYLYAALLHISHGFRITGAASKEGSFCGKRLIRNLHESDN